jgi:hypothetical protein
MHSGGTDYQLSPHALLIAEALRDAGDEGLTLQEIAAASGTRWPDRPLRALRRAGYVIGRDGDVFVLVSEPRGAVSTEASDEGRPAILRETGPASAGTIGQASDASVETAPRLFEPPVPGVYREAA